MSTDKKELLRHRRALYFDCIAGTGTAIFSLTAIFIVTRVNQITNMVSFLFGVGFWIAFLGLSLFIIAIGLRGFYLEKKYPEGVPTKKKVRAPIVS